MLPSNYLLPGLNCYKTASTVGNRCCNAGLSRSPDNHKHGSTAKSIHIQHRGHHFHPTGAVFKHSLTHLLFINNTAIMPQTFRIPTRIIPIPSHTILSDLVLAHTYASDANNSRSRSTCIAISTFARLIWGDGDWTTYRRNTRVPGRDRRPSGADGKKHWKRVFFAKMDAVVRAVQRVDGGLAEVVRGCREEMRSPNLGWRRH